MLIGLTGQTGAGKSTAARLLTERGLAVIDCDRLSREVTASGQSGLAVIAREFGPGVLSPEGALNRRALGRIVFADREQLRRLDELLFPLILAAVQKETAALTAAGEKAILLDAPTLYESGADKLCAAVVAVLAAPEIRRSRICKRDGLTAEEAERRMKNQLSEEFFRSHADMLIENNGSLRQLAAQADIVYARIKEWPNGR